MDDDFLKRVIFDLLYYRRAPITRTAAFRDQMHNDDLVPAIEHQLDQIVSLFERYHRVVYDTQGLRDRGIDVLARYRREADADGPCSYIGFQIKSFRDLEEQGWLKNLKAQVYEAHLHADMADFYVLLCTDGIAHRAKLRDARAELATDPSTHVVDPEFVGSFIDLSPYEIGGYLKRKLSEDDPVIIEALAAVEGLSLPEAAIVIELAVLHYLDGIRAMDVSVLRDSEFVTEAYERENAAYGAAVDLPRVVGPEPKLTLDERRQRDMEALDTDWFELSTSTDRIDLNVERMHAIGALILDGHVRYGWDAWQVREYLMNILMVEQIEFLHRQLAEARE